MKGRSMLQRREDVLKKKIETIFGKIEKWGVIVVALNPR